MKSETIKDLVDFLSRLKDANIYYELADPIGAVMVKVAVPGERWEIEFHSDGQVGVEVFKSRGNIENSASTDELFSRFSD